MSEEIGADEAAGPIVLREPGKAVKANVFWGVLRGGLLIVPALFGPPEASALSRFGMGAAGVLVLSAMGLLIIRNRSRRVRLRNGIVELSSAFRSSRFPLSEVAGVEERNIKKDLRAFELGDMPKYHTTPLDTRPDIIKYELRDSAGRILLSLDRGAEPAEGLARFLEAARKAADSRFRSHDETR